VAARTVPTLPSWTAGQRVLASQLQQITTWGAFSSNPPGFSMQMTVNNAAANNVYTQMPMDALDWDTDSGRAAGTPWAYTIPIGMAGRWQFSYKISWAVNATGDRLVALYKNGVIVSSGQISGPPTTTAHNPENSTTRTVLCSAGDVMSVFALQSSGGSLNATSGFFEGRLVSQANP
jgi:hypothetical protein